MNAEALSAQKPERSFRVSLAALRTRSTSSSARHMPRTTLSKSRSSIFFTKNSPLRLRPAGGCGIISSGRPLISQWSLLALVPCVRRGRGRFVPLSCVDKNFTVQYVDFCLTFAELCNVEFRRKGGEKVPKRNNKQTSRKVASIASGILRDNRYSSKSKSAAASALAQARPKKK